MRSTVTRRPAVLVPVLVWAALVTLLLVAALTPGHFGDQAAPYRLVVYPVLALVLPAVWRVTRPGDPVPLAATTLVMLPFLLDTVGNVLDLYGAISWWDDLNHVANWFLLSLGVGLALIGRVRPRWALVVVVTGLGAALSIAWELGEWATFYSAPYSARLYEDTLADQTLGSLGALAAGVVVQTVARRRERRSDPQPS